jgi:hypothetical protein
MDDAAIESLLDEFKIPFGRLVRFTNGNCFITHLDVEPMGLENTVAKLATIGFSDIRSIDEGTLIWFTVNGRTIEENNP